jgi:hypothetical protein
MASPEAGAMEIIAVPRFSIGRLCELRGFLDQTMICLSSEDQFLGGGKHGEVESWPEESVRESATGGRIAGAATAEGSTIARVAVDRSPRNPKRMRGSRGATGGPQ